MTDAAPATTAEAEVPEWTLGWRLRRALAHGGVATDEMAAELGVVRGTVSRWMNDHGASPRPVYVRQWALRTGVPYEWLMTGRTSAADAAAPAPQRSEGASLTSVSAETRSR